MKLLINKLWSAAAARFRDRTTDSQTQERSVGSPDYEQRMASEVRTYEGQVNVHDLPEIFHYWSNRYLRPILEDFGFSHPEAFFEQQLAQAYDSAERSAVAPARFVSVGSGNCDAEVRIATALVASGRHHFVLECLDINPAMLARGKALAEAAGVAAQLEPLQADFNDWFASTAS